MERFFIFLMVALAAAAGGGTAVTVYENEAVLHWTYGPVSQDQSSFAAWEQENWDQWVATLPASARRRMETADLQDHAAIGVYMGERPTGGYQIAIAKVELKGEWLIATLAQRSPGPGEMVIQAFTYPTDLVLLEKSLLFQEGEAPVGVRFVNHEGIRLKDVRF